jgi:hypothetical protein
MALNLLLSIVTLLALLSVSLHPSILIGRYRSVCRSVLIGVTGYSKQNQSQRRVKAAIAGVDGSTEL